jgi:pyridoxine/pyridoxamine 5'-phosphate oxidase
MKIPLPTPQEIRQQIWKELGRATQDRHHAWRTPVLSTASADRSVNSRTVVLRSVDASEGQLQIYTDARSAKLKEIALQPLALFVFWSPRLRWQLRVSVSLERLTAGAQMESRWERVRQSPSASDYLSPTAPGSPLASDASLPLEATQKISHFAVLNAQVLEIDWLELASTGHRRAKIIADEWEWLTP